MAPPLLAQAGEFDYPVERADGCTVVARERSWPYERRYGRCVEREELISLLADGSPAYEACRKALERGASFDISDGLVPASNLAPTYRVREVQTRERGIPTLGFAAAVEMLQTLGEQPLRLGGVRQPEPPYYYQLFLAVDGASVLACIGMDQQHQAHRRRPAARP